MEEISHNTTVREKEKPFKCNIFQTSFGKKYVLNSHQRLDHKTEKMIICKICLKIFGSKFEEWKHLQLMSSKDGEGNCI